MFEKVLFPTDLSKYALKVLDYLDQIPGIREVVLFHVIDLTPSHASSQGPQIIGAILDEAEARLKEQKVYLEEKGLKAKMDLGLVRGDLDSGFDLLRLYPEIEMIEGADLADAIQKAADIEGTSLVAIGAAGKGFIRGTSIGRSSAEVLKSGKTDLLIFRPKVHNKGYSTIDRFYSNIFGRVLCPMDFSKPSEEVLSLVRSMTDINEVALVHVIDGKQHPEDIDFKSREAASILQQHAKDLEEAGLDVTVHVLQGDPAQELVLAVERIQASMIIMRSQGEGWSEHTGLGRVAFDVARIASRPVLMVKQYCDLSH